MKSIVGFLRGLDPLNMVAWSGAMFISCMLVAGCALMCAGIIRLIMVIF